MIPWGPEAFQKAEKEDKAILLSIGYSTCHWCHVMERESFEDEEVAEAMNDAFIINTTRNFPYRANPPLLCLRNGAPVWGIPNLLRPMYSERIIRQIMREIEYGGHQVYQVRVEHRGSGREVVSVEMLDGLS